jgi:hypothetical protein
VNIYKNSSNTHSKSYHHTPNNCLDSIKIQDILRLHFTTTKASQINNMHFTPTPLILATLTSLTLGEVCISGTFIPSTTVGDSCTYTLDATIVDNGVTTCSGNGGGADPSWTANCISGYSAFVETAEGAFSISYTNAAGTTIRRPLNIAVPPFGFCDDGTLSWDAIPECA